MLNVEYLEEIREKFERNIEIEKSFLTNIRDITMDEMIKICTSNATYTTEYKQLIADCLGYSSKLISNSKKQKS